MAKTQEIMGELIWQTTTQYAKGSNIIGAVCIKQSRNDPTRPDGDIEEMLHQIRQEREEDYQPEAYQREQKDNTIRAILKEWFTHGKHKESPEQAIDNLQGLLIEWSRSHSTT